MCMYIMRAFNLMLSLESCYTNSQCMASWQHGEVEMRSVVESFGVAFKFRVVREWGQSHSRGLPKSSQANPGKQLDSAVRLMKLDLLSLCILMRPVAAQSSQSSRAA